jgi:hypothetical protein
MELIYSTQSSGFDPDKHYRNPAHFDRPEAGVTGVVVVGEWPKVVDAYENVGVEVTREEAEPQLITDYVVQNRKKPAYVEAFSRAGYSLMLLTDSELGKKSGELADWLTIRVSDYKSFEKPVFKKEEYEKLVTEWKDSYYEHMSDLDIQRKGC